MAVLEASQLVTLAGPARQRVGPEMAGVGIIKNGGVLVVDGIISTVGTTSEIERQMPQGCEVIDASGKVVLPGFVDAHAHPIFGGDRVDEFEMRAKGKSYEEIAAAGGGIRSTVAKTRAATDVELRAKLAKHAHWFLRCGTTTVEAKSGYGLTVEDELRLLRIINPPSLARSGGEGVGGRGLASSQLEFVPTFLGAHAIPSEHTPEEYVQLVIDEMLPRVAEERLAEYCDIFCERGYFSVEQSRRILTAAKQLSLGLRMHADQLTNSGAAQLAAELKAKTADHLEMANEQDIEALRAAGVMPVLLPGSVYALGSSHYPPGRQMIDAGLPLVLATDFNPGSSPTPSIPMVMSLACTHMRLTPAEALAACTINAAYSLDRGDTIGSLEPGKRANFVIWDCADYRELAYYFGFVPSNEVFIDGCKIDL